MSENNSTINTAMASCCSDATTNQWNTLVIQGALWVQFHTYIEMRNCTNINHDKVQKAPPRKMCNGNGKTHEAALQVGQYDSTGDFQLLLSLWICSVIYSCDAVQAVCTGCC